MGQAVGNNRGKSISDCLVEIQAEQSWQKHATNAAAMKASRQRVTALRNRIQKLNEQRFTREGNPIMGDVDYGGYPDAQ